MLALAVEGTAAEGDWLIAERQVAGRGRMGRSWVSPSGNLYATGLVRVRLGDPPAATLALTAGVAVHETLSIWAEGMQIKWPNDILAPLQGVSERGKIAGILLEREGDAVAVGVGVNLAHYPDLHDRRATSLAALGADVPPPVFAEALAEIFLHWLERWRGEGVAVVRAAWLDRAHSVGAALSAVLPDGDRIDGLFDGLTPDCALRLRLADGATRVIHAGDVFLI